MATLKDWLVKMKRVVPPYDVHEIKVSAFKQDTAITIAEYNVQREHGGLLVEWACVSAVKVKLNKQTV